MSESDRKVGDRGILSGKIPPKITYVFQHVDRGDRLRSCKNNGVSLWGIDNRH